ncbi:MAG: zinc-dependent metalloprotease [Planctomycetota bacterium]
MRQGRGTFILATLFSLSLYGTVWAQEQPVATPAVPAPAEKPKEYPDFAEVVTAEFTKIEGFYNIYKHNEKEIAYIEIPAGTLEQDFLVATTVSAGSYFTGWQWSDAMLYWKIFGKKLVLMQKQLQYRTADTSSPLGQSVARTYKDTLISTYSIETMNGGNPVLNLSSITLGDIGTFFGSMFSPGNTSMAKFVQLKAFSENVEIAIEFPDSEGAFITLHYSFRNLPASDYQPREADDRIGYFLSVHKDLTAGKAAENLFVRYINRWNLKKQDAELKKSPVINPIIFYIEKTVPIKYRYSVREGIAEWNKAFEKMGYLDAIEVRQQTDTNEFKDLDPADSRYNFFRWITSGEGFAMGPSRVDPRTGEILDADIIFDDDMLRWSLFEYDTWFRDEASKHRDSRFSPQKYKMAKSRDGMDSDQESYSYSMMNKRDQRIMKAIESGQWQPKRPLCFMGKGKALQMRFAGAYFSLLPFGNRKEGEEAPAEGPKEKTWPEDFLHQVIKETVMHEVGHTLGLRHNFKGSCWHNLDELNSKAIGSNPPEISASVMDYNPINIKPAKGTVQGNYAMTTLGPYDYWAIEYGYSTEANAEEFAKIATKCAESGLDYGTDEDLWSPDPLIKVWELGNDPIAYAKYRLDLAKLLLENLQKRSLKTGDTYVRLTRAFNMVLGEHSSAGSLALLTLGGANVHRDHFGDPNGRDPVKLIPSQKQREALKFVCDIIFAPDAFKFAPEILTKLGTNNWMHWGSGGYWKEHSFDIYGSIASVQEWVLYDLFTSDMLDRLLNNELKSTEKDTLTLPEVFGTLREAVWAELKQNGKESTNQSPLINGYRRNLQRSYLQNMFNLAMADEYSSTPHSARTLAWFELKTLKNDIEKAKATNNLSKDAYTTSHLDETAKRIQKAIDAAYSLSK